MDRTNSHNSNPRTSSSRNRFSLKNEFQRQVSCKHKKVVMNKTVTDIECRIDLTGNDTARHQRSKTVES